MIKDSECTERYKIKLSLEIEDIHFESLNYLPLLDESRILNSGYNDIVKELWNQKSRLNSYFDNNNQDFYYKARNLLFPQDKSGSLKFRNRAGDKLWEINEEINLFPKKGVFFDVCGGPGAWSEVLLKQNNSWTGFGMTLKLSDTKKCVLWYDHLEHDSRWKSVWGEDGTGNVYNLNNLENVGRKIGKNVNLVVADGGLNISKNELGEDQEHLQELYSGRIILGEFISCLCCLEMGGNWCCKLFDTFSHFTSSIIYLTGLCFESTYIIKPFRSRIVNSERYLIGKNMKKKNIKLIEHIKRIYREWNDNNVVEAIIPVAFMEKDLLFQKTFRMQVHELCRKQTLALKKVIDLADELKG